MKKRVRRVGVLCLVVCLLAGMVSGCGGTSKADNEKTLFVYNWSEYIPPEVYKMFEEETGYHVVESTFSSNEEMLAKLVAGGSGQYDLIVASNYVIPAMQKQKLIKKLDISKLKNFGNLSQSAVGMDFDKENQYSVPYMATITMIAVNKPKLAELGVEIKSFNDLLNPALKNNIVCPDDCRELVDMALKATGQDPDSRDETIVAGTYDWLSKLAPNIKLYDSDTPYTALATNEAAVGIVYNMDAALAMKENPDIELLKIEEPCEIAYDNFVLTSGSKKQEMAQEFIDFILRPDVYKLCLEQYPCVCLNEKALELMDKEFLDNPASNVDPEEIKRAHLTGDVGDAASYYDDVFSRMKN
ncbi:MAG: spermidine/putrescine ABC transporter substrate-binding protein [Lachnospiraceae bacterium]